ncbi:YlaF family protein, partial [Staphylococcus aureus]|nr:YlaF family protein [Staphylococcus aureus]
DVYKRQILLVATFGIGFTTKKKYRENDWL